MSNIVLNNGDGVTVLDSTNTKAVPIDGEGRGIVNTYEDIVNIRNPYLYMRVIVRNNSQDGTHLKGEYIITSLTNIGKVDVTGIKSFKEYVAESDPNVPAHVKAITQQNITDWNGKQDAISPTNTLSPNSIKDTTMNGKIAAYDNSGVLGNSGVDTTNVAVKSEMSITDGTGADAGTATIQLKSGTSKKVLTQHQDISGKINKVQSATNGNFAGLNSNGEVVDSGKSVSDFATAAQGANADNAIQGIKLNNGSDLTPDSNKKVSIPTMIGATSSAAGAVGLIPAPAAGDNEKILQGNGTWVTKPSDGLSAYELYVEEYKTAHSGDASGAKTEAQWLASLKAQFGSFVSALYCTDTGHVGEPADSNGLITASATTTNHIYLVDDDPDTPAEKVMWITVVDDTDPQDPQYNWTSIGDVQVNLTFDSGQAVNNVKIKDEAGEKVTGNADVLSAEAGMELNLGLNGGYRVTGREDINPLTDLTDIITSGYLKVVSSGWSWVVAAGNGSTAFLTLSNLGISPTHIVIKASTAESQVAFLKQKLPSSNVANSGLRSGYIADNGQTISGTSYPYHRVVAGQTKTLEIPTGTNFISIKLSTGSYNYTPAAISFFNGTYVEGLTAKVGDTTQLNTTTKTSLVAAVNELKADMGDNLKFVVGTKVTLSEGFGNINTRIPTGICGKTAYKYKITCDNSAGSSAAECRLFPNTTSEYIKLLSISAGTVWSYIVEIANDIKQFYISCNSATASITIDVLGSNEDMFPLDLKTVGLEQGNLTNNSSGQTPAKFSDPNVIRLVGKIPAIKRDWNGLRVWFATLPPSIVREGVDLSGYSWHYRCYFLNAEGENIAYASAWTPITNSFDAANNFDNSNLRNAAYIWLTFSFRDSDSHYAAITPEDIPFGSLRMVMGRDYSSVVESMNLRGTKVTTINSSSTDEQIPTAKAVYEFASGSAGAVSYLSAQDLTDEQENQATKNIGLGGRYESSFTKTSSSHSSTNDRIKIDVKKRQIIKIGLYSELENAANYAQLYAYDKDDNGISLGTPQLNGLKSIEAPIDIAYVGVYVAAEGPAGDYTLKAECGVACDFQRVDIISLNNEAITLIKAAKCQAYLNASGSDAYGKSGYGKFLAFLHLTDTHDNFDCMERAMYFAQETGLISQVFHTGDIIDSGSTRKESEWGDLLSEYTMPILAIPGNHEFAGTPYTDLEIHSWLYKAAYQSRNGETHPTINGEEKNYWYKDVDVPNFYINSELQSGKKIRIIGTYDFELPDSITDGVGGRKSLVWYTQDQIDWFIERLDETLSNNYVGVIVLSHYVLSKSKFIDSNFVPDLHRNNESDGDIMSSNFIVNTNPYFFAEILNAFANGTTVDTSVTLTIPNLATTMLTAEHKFASSGKLIANVCGHKHSGGMLYMLNNDAEHTMNGKLRVVMSPCSTNKDGQNSKWWGRSQYNENPLTNNVDCVNVIVYDHIRDVVKVIRVGSNINNNLEECKAICLKVNGN